MMLYFSHGKESGPWGSKIRRLAELAREQGLSVDSIDYTRCPDPEARVECLLNVLSRSPDEPTLLVGSSMGGYVSVRASEQTRVRAMFLLAPALYMEGYAGQTHTPLADRIEIVHGWSDDVIPPEHSIRFAREHQASLHLIPGDHRLNTSLPAIEPLFQRFLINAGQ